MDDVRWMMVHSRMAPYGASKDGNGFSCSLGLSHSLFPLCTAPSGLLFSAKLASPHGSPNTAEAIYEDFCMAAFPFVYDSRRKWVFHGKNHGKLSGMPFFGTGFLKHRKAKTRRRRYAEK